MYTLDFERHELMTIIYALSMANSTEASILLGKIALNMSAIDRNAYSTDNDPDKE